MEIYLLMYTIALIVLGKIIYDMANKRNRNKWGWTLGSVATSPLIGIILLIILKDKKG